MVKAALLPSLSAAFAICLSTCCCPSYAVGSAESASSQSSSPKRLRFSLHGKAVFPESPSHPTTSSTRDESDKGQTIVNRSLSRNHLLDFGRRLKHPRWLRLPSRDSIFALKNSNLAALLVSGFQAGIILYFCVEIYRAFREVQREFLDEGLGNVHSSLDGPKSGNAVMSPKDAENLVAWLDLPSNERRNPPRGVPSFMVSLANDLKLYCHSITNRHLCRVLSRLSKAEAQMLQACLMRPSRAVSFDNLRGFDYVTHEILNSLHHNGYSSRQNTLGDSSPYSALMQKGRQGIALWGPPGCGKSTLIKAIADKTRIPTLIVTPSLLQRKFYGESTNQVRTLFSLVSNLGPCIVVIDELDGIFRARGREDHEAGREMKTEFLQWWDGVVSEPDSDSRVLIVGATNRPFDVDSAVWRRLPQRFYIGAADWNGRYSICEEWIRSYKIPTKDADSISKCIADHTQGYTNSDLLQVLQTACRNGPMSRDHSVVENLELTTEDVARALQTVSPTRFSQDYLTQLQNFLSPQDLSRFQNGPGTNAQFKVENNSHVWRTPLGNFYQFNIPVDGQVFDVLNEMWLRYHEWEDSDAYSFEEDEEDEPSESEDF